MGVLRCSLRWVSQLGTIAMSPIHSIFILEALKILLTVIFHIRLCRLQCWTRCIDLQVPHGT